MNNISVKIYDIRMLKNDLYLYSYNLILCPDLSKANFDVFCIMMFNISNILVKLPFGLPYTK